MKLDFQRRRGQGLFRQSAAFPFAITAASQSLDPQHLKDALLSSYCEKAETQKGELTRVTMLLSVKFKLKIQTA